jgi:hypothetical protein
MSETQELLELSK